MKIDSKRRLSSLYFVKNEKGEKVPFSPNKEQSILLNGMHPCMLVLKARQLGITTFFCIYVLDKILFTPNIQAGIIAHSLSDAENIFRDKLKFAYDNLPDFLKKAFPPIGDNAKELAFSNGSSIRVGTSLRSSTLQYLHISEFGKICIKYPEKAREIITGSFNTVHAGQSIFVESTAEGNAGAFFEMCEKAKNAKTELSPLDFKFFFFPWWNKPDYALPAPEDFETPVKLSEYFDSLSRENIVLSKEQKYWYFKKQSIQQEDMLREFPSVPQEAFEASKEGYWYSSQLKSLRDEGRVREVLYDRTEVVYTSWDLGQRDPTSIWFFQLIENKIFFIDFFQTQDTSLDLVTVILKQKMYNYSTCIWPHDAKARERSGGTFADQARLLGWSGINLKSSSVLWGINLVRMTLSKCYFDKTRCARGLAFLGSYKKSWNSSLGGWTSDPVHDESSHAADAMRYACAGYRKVGGASSIEQTFEIASKYLRY